MPEGPSRAGSIAIYGLILYGIVWLAKLAGRFIATPAFLVLFVLIVGVQFIRHELERFWHFQPTVSVASSVIEWAKHSSPDPILSMDHVHWLSLTVSSTYETPFHPTYAACFIHGPVYYDPEQGLGDNGGFISKLEASQTESARYVGERQLVVKLIPVSMVNFPHDDSKDELPVLPVAYRYLPWRSPTAVEDEVMYVLTTPRTRLLPDDVVGGCKFSERDFHVDAKLGWISGGDPVLTGKLVNDSHVADRSVLAIATATQGQQ